MEIIDVNDFTIDVDKVSSEMLIGPMNEVAKLVNNFNKKYLLNNYMYGNRSYLEPLEPLKFTRTYQWGRGYKDIIVQAMLERFLQFNKGGSLPLMLQRRPDNMQWKKNQFVKDVLEIDDHLKTLRSRKLTTDTDVESAKEAINHCVEKIINKTRLVKEFIDSLDNIDSNIYFMSVNGDDFRSISNDSRNEILETSKLLTSKLVIEFAFLKPSVRIVDSKSNHLGDLEHEPMFVKFELGFYSLVEHYMKAGTLNNMVWSEYHNSDNMVRAYLQNYLLRESYESNYRQNNNARAHYSGINSSHPYISTSRDRYANNDNWYFDKWIFGGADLSTLCFGNLHSDIYNAIARLNIDDALAYLLQWQTYTVGKTHPLNNIQMLFLSVPEDKYDKTILAELAFQEEQMYARLFRSFGYDTFGPNIEYVGREDYYSDDYISDDHLILLYGKILTDTFRGYNFLKKGWSIDRRSFPDDFLPFPSDEEVLEVIADNIECIIAAVDATVRYLNEEKCLTRSTKMFKEMEEFNSAIMDGDFELPWYQTCKVSSPEVVEEETSFDPMEEQLIDMQKLLNSLDDKQMEEQMEEMMFENLGRSAI